MIAPAFRARCDSGLKWGRGPSRQELDDVAWYNRADPDWFRYLKYVLSYVRLHCLPSRRPLSDGLPPPKCHFPRRKYKTPLASKLPSLAPAFLAPFVGFVGSPDLLDDPSGLFFPGPPSLRTLLARSLPACPASFLPSPVCFLLTLYLERASEGAGEGGEICPERNIMITPRVRRALGREGRRRRRRKKWFCKREGAAALVEMVHSLFEPRWRYWPWLERGKIGGWSEERSKWESVSRIAKLLLRVGTFVHGRRRDGWRRRAACVRAGAAEVGARDRYGELNCGKLDLVILLSMCRLPTPT